jgi:hypothetical protein
LRSEEKYFFKCVKRKRTNIRATSAQARKVIPERIYIFAFHPEIAKFTGTYLAIGERLDS